MTVAGSNAPDCTRGNNVGLSQNQQQQNSTLLAVVVTNLFAEILQRIVRLNRKSPDQIRDELAKR